MSDEREHDEQHHHAHELAAKVVAAVLADLGERRGFEAWWGDIDEDVQQEVRRDLTARVAETLEGQGRDAILERLTALAVGHGDIVIIRLPTASGDVVRELAMNAARFIWAERHVPVIVAPEELVFGALPLREPTEART